MNRSNWVLLATAVTGLSLVTVGLLGVDLEESRPVCYLNSPFIFCPRSLPDTVIVHETLWGLVALGAFLLVGCGLSVFAGLKWPPRKRNIHGS